MTDLLAPVRALRRRPEVGDVVLVVLLLAFITVASVGAGSGAFGLSVLQVLPLAWRRRRPFEVALAIAGLCLLQVIAIDGPTPGNIAVPIAVYSAAAFGTRTQSWQVLGVALVGAVLAGFDWRVRFTDVSQQLVQIGSSILFLGMFVAVAWALGDVVRRRKAVIARLEHQNAALARDQAQRTRLAAQGERASIAREMHDVVAHSLAVVVVQADGALYAARAALDRPPAIGPDREALERAAQTLDTLAQTARTSLADTRRLVGVLRDDAAGVELGPTQGLALLDELVQRVRDSGVPVHLAVRGEIEDLPAEVDLAAYRVVQEALTNVLKHAGAHATVDVDLLRTPAVLLVRVTDDGAGAAAAEDPAESVGGNGIVGMRERVEVLDGTVHAGPRRGHGWEVVATIPVVGRDGIPSGS
jgi:signal transduction histidine kinase